MTRESFCSIDEFMGTKFISFNSPRATYLSIFLTFLSIEILNSIWKENTWWYESGRKQVFGGVFDLCNIYKFLAIKIRIQGIHFTPQRNIFNGKALTDAMQDISTLFQNRFPGKPPGRNI